MIKCANRPRVNRRNFKNNFTFTKSLTRHRDACYFTSPTKRLTLMKMEKTHSFYFYTADKQIQSNRTEPAPVHRLLNQLPWNCVSFQCSCTCTARTIRDRRSRCLRCPMCLMYKIRRDRSLPKMKHNNHFSMFNTTCVWTDERKEHVCVPSRYLSPHSNIASAID